MSVEEIVHTSYADAKSANTSWKPPLYRTYMSPRNVPISMAPKVPSRGGTSGGAGILVTVALVDIG